MLVGLDFDNTLVRYDSVFAAVAAAVGLTLPPGADKTTVRSAARAEDDGEVLWQTIQAEVYAARMEQAELFDGVTDALTRLAEAGHTFAIVSHKTRHAKRDPHQRDLHALARAFLRAHKLTGDGGPISDDTVFFEPTRDAKITRIRALGCAWFVDDLPEVLLDSSFPESTNRILFAPNGSAPGPGIALARHWTDVAEIVR